MVVCPIKEKSVVDSAHCPYRAVDEHAGIGASGIAGNSAGGFIEFPPCYGVLLRRRGWSWRYCGSRRRSGRRCRRWSRGRCPAARSYAVIRYHHIIKVAGLVCATAAVAVAADGKLEIGVGALVANRVHVGKVKLYCSPLRHARLQRSTLWLTSQEVSHAPTPMGRQD